MAQMSPNYPFMTSSVNEIIINPLVAKYGSNDVVHIIAIMEMGSISFYIYEVSEFSRINHKDDNRPVSASGKVNYFVDYTATPRLIIPPFEKLKPFVGVSFNCTYDFILKSDSYNSIDIDYAWKIDNQWKAIELTTVYMPLSSKEESERLVKMFSRRPSWQGVKGAHGIRKLIEVASDLGLNYYMVVVNSAKGVSNDLVTTGNAFWFPLTHENIDRILSNKAPVNSTFDKFSSLLAWL